MDDDLQDLDRQWKKVLLGYQKMEQLHAEKQKVEARTRQIEGMENYEARDLETRMKEEAEIIQKAAEKCNRDVEALKERVEKTKQEVQATRPPPGVAAARAARGGAGGGAGGDARRARRVIVPSGTEPVSMFSPGFLSLIHI